MGRKSKVSDKRRRDAVLRYLAGEDSGAALARTCRVSDSTLSRWQNAFLATAEANRPVVNSGSVTPPETDKPKPEPLQMHLDSLLRDCPACGRKMTADYPNRRTIIMSDDAFEQPFRHFTGVPVALTLSIRRCHNSACHRFLVPYRPELEGRMAPPRQKLSLMILKRLQTLQRPYKVLTSRKLQNRLLRYEVAVTGRVKPAT